MMNKTPRRYCHCIDSVYTDAIDLSHKPERDQRTEGKQMAKAIKKSGKYNLYKTNDGYELWYGNIAGQWSFRAGYVSNPDNFEMAVDAAEEEMRCLMNEAL